MHRPPPGWRPPPEAIHVAGFLITADREREWSIDALAQRAEQTARDEVAELRRELAKRDREAGTRAAELRALVMAAGGACN